METLHEGPVVAGRTLGAVGVAGNSSSVVFRVDIDEGVVRERVQNMDWDMSLGYAEIEEEEIDRY